jgi:hypothetical protein
MSLSAKGPVKLVIFQGEKNNIIEYDRRAAIHVAGAPGIICNYLMPMVVTKPYYVAKSDNGEEQIINRVVILAKLIMSKNYCILPGVRLLFIRHPPLIAFLLPIFS